VRRLRPEVLDMLGLHGAVEEMVNHYRSSGVHFEFHSEGDFSRIGNELAISAYRIVQEALSNIMKHSRAGFARVSLVLSETGMSESGTPGGALHIEVQDDGEGFDPALASEGIGIIGMRERVFALGGSIRVQSSPGDGTLVAITLPVGGAPCGAPAV
jgi:two-component system sensor histidine kinase UhpB